MRRINDYELIDLPGISEMLHVSPHTPNQWRQRSRNQTLHPPLPNPVPNIKKPVWKRVDIVDWAAATGRWCWDQEGSPDEYLERVGVKRGAMQAPAAPDVTTSPDVVLPISTNPDIPLAVFHAAA